MGAVVGMKPRLLMSRRSATRAAAAALGAAAAAAAAAGVAVAESETDGQVAHSSTRDRTHAQLTP
jgi:hypothetical protein